MNANSKSRKAVQFTTRHDVGFFTSDGKAIFSVNAGIPLHHAFDQLSVLLSSAQEAVEALAMSSEDTNEVQAHWAPAHLLTFASALVHSMHEGHLAREENTITDADLADVAV